MVQPLLILARVLPDQLLVQFIQHSFSFVSDHGRWRWLCQRCQLDLRAVLLPHSPVSFSVCMQIHPLEGIIITHIFHTSPLDLPQMALPNFSLPVFDSLQLLESHQYVVLCKPHALREKLHFILQPSYFFLSLQSLRFYNVFTALQYHSLLLFLQALQC